jgi:hypothetical protein
VDATTGVAYCFDAGQERPSVAAGGSRVVQVNLEAFLYPRITGRYVVSLYRTEEVEGGAKTRRVRALPPLTIDVPRRTDAEVAVVLERLRESRETEEPYHRLPGDWTCFGDERLLAPVAEALAAWEASPRYRDASEKERAAFDLRTEHVRRDLARCRVLADLEAGRDEEVRAWLAEPAGRGRDESRFHAMVEARRAALAKARAAAAAPAPTPR